MYSSRKKQKLQTYHGGCILLRSFPITLASGNSLRPTRQLKAEYFARYKIYQESILGHLNRPSPRPRPNIQYVPHAMPALSQRGNVKLSTQQGEKYTMKVIQSLNFLTVVGQHICPFTINLIATSTFVNVGINSQVRCHGIAVLTCSHSVS